jgi:Rne/Rng family ribonuclease
MKHALDIVVDEKDGALWAAALDQKKRLFALECDTPGEEIRWGSIFLGRVKTIDRKLDAAWIDLGDGRMGLMPHKEWPDKDQEPDTGSMLIVQAKTGIDQQSGKPDERKLMQKVREEPKVTRLSSDVTLPGRYLIYAPKEMENRLSRRVRDRDLRQRMKSMLEELDEELSGCILRAAAASLQTDILLREGHILQENWQMLQDRAADLSEPQQLLRGPNAIERVLSDMASSTIEQIEVAIMEHLDRAEVWCETFAPDLVTKIAPIEIANATEDFALFDHYDLIEQIEELVNPYILLPDDGNLIIQETSALWAIDVNRGSDQKNSNLDLNLQAAEEIGRQLRLRNIGGILIIDFLKTKNQKEREMITTALEKAVSWDTVTVQIHGLTSLGLMELTRQKRLPSLKERVRGSF